MVSAFSLGVSRKATMMVYLGGQLLKEQYSTTILHYLPFTLVCLKFRFRTYLLVSEASVPPSYWIINSRGLKSVIVHWKLV